MYVDFVRYDLEIQVVTAFVTDVNMEVHTAFVRTFTTCLQTRFRKRPLVNAMRSEGKIGLDFIVYRHYLIKR